MRGRPLQGNKLCILFAERKNESKTLANSIYRTFISILAANIAYISDG